MFQYIFTQIQSTFIIKTLTNASKSNLLDFFNLLNVEFDD